MPSFGRLLVAFVVSVILVGCDDASGSRDGGQSSDASSEAGSSSDGAVDASADAGKDAAVDAGKDGGQDASVDAAVDASAEAGVDASVDAGSDAGACTCSGVSTCCDGCVPQNLNGACDDGSSSTYGDKCSAAGTCAGTPCECSSGACCDGCHLKAYDTDCAPTSYTYACDVKALSRTPTRHICTGSTTSCDGTQQGVSDHYTCSGGCWVDPQDPSTYWCSPTMPW